VPTEIDPKVRAEYRALIGAADSDPVVVAGSTHRGEEAALLRAFAELRQGGFPGLRLVLVPRHPERLDEVERLAAAVAPVIRRSRLSSSGSLQPPASSLQPVVLVDTLGELARLYATADAVFVGGSLIRHGGQNMMEPCGLARPTVVGPSSFNFPDAVAVLRACQGIREIASAAELSGALRAILSDPAAAAAMGQRGREALIAQQGATAKSLERIDAVLKEQF
jgi:3-deoxy-D-manno-octulosonic-acid transferase